MAFIVIRAEMKPSHTFDKANGLVTKERWSGIREAQTFPDVTTDWLTLENHLFLLNTTLSSGIAYCLKCGHSYQVFQWLSESARVENK